MTSREVSRYLRDMTTDEIIRRIADYAASMRWSKTHLANSAGVPESTLRRFGSPDWSPTLRTLRLLERVVPRDFPTATCSENKDNAPALPEQAA